MGRLLKRPVYVRVLTSQIHPDMTRYMGYRDVPETSTPERYEWSAGDLPWMHRIQIDGFTCFMRPSVFNRFWEWNAVDRYRSFGITATIQKGL